MYVGVRPSAGAWEISLIKNESPSVMPVTPHCGLRPGDHRCRDLDWLALVEDRSHLVF